MYKFWGFFILLPYYNQYHIIMRKQKHQTMITIRKTVSLWTLAATLFAGAITLTSCSNNEDDYKKPYDVTDEDRVKYAEGVLGTTIDPEQDWVLTSECSVTIAANARLEGTSMVAILQGNPYGGKSFIIAVKPATVGTENTLSFRAPQGVDYLYAACINNDGKCIARPFTPGKDMKVSFMEAPVAVAANAPLLRRATDPETEVVTPFYATFRIKDFIDVRKALFYQLPDKRKNWDKLKDASILLRIKQNDYNFYELPVVFMGGIGKDHNESDNDNLWYYWHQYDQSSQARFLMKDHFKNSFQPGYDSDTQMYTVEGMYLVGKDQDGKNTKQFSAGDILDFGLAMDEEPFSRNEVRVKIFTMNDYLFAACEDGVESEGTLDWDFNDRLFWFPYGTVNTQDGYEPFEPIPSSPRIWTYAWEDKDFGDYDMNDCVIEVQENDKDNSKLDISLMALGGARELWLGFENKNAKTYNDYPHVFEEELHKVLGISVGQMANTGNGTLSRDSVKITLPKPAGFDFQKCSFILGARVTPEMQGVYDSDYYAISIAQKGQDPHGIVIPGRWQWPTEKTCITQAYSRFADWAHNIKDPTSKNWYMFPVEGKVVNR